MAIFAGPAAPAEGAERVSGLADEVRGKLRGLQAAERLAVRLTGLARRSCRHGRPLAANYEIPAALTHKDLIELAEASDTQTTKDIKRFRDLKWINVLSNRHVVLLQPEALERYHLS